MSSNQNNELLPQARPSGQGHLHQRHQSNEHLPLFIDRPIFAGVLWALILLAGVGRSMAERVSNLVS